MKDILEMMEMHTTLKMGVYYVDVLKERVYVKKRTPVYSRPT